MKVTIVISTKDRKFELKKCLDSCLKLKGIHEILVYDDGSSDGTFEFVKSNFPEISVFRGETSMGLINARTYCASLASGDILVSIDDDCVFQGEETIIEIIPFFDLSTISVVTIPCIDVLVDPSIITQKGIGSTEEVYITSQFRGCAHAIRKDHFLKIGGYFNNLVRQEEETDLSIRLWQKGYKVRVGNCSNPILHYHSVVRNENMISYYRSRNQFLVNYRLLPFFFLLIFGFKQFVQTMFYEIKNGRLKYFLKGFIEAIKLVITAKVYRTPLSYSSYWSFKKLRLNRIMKVS